MRGLKYQITLKKDVSEKLEKLCQEKGLSKSGAISLALTELVKKEKEKR